MLRLQAPRAALLTSVPLSRQDRGHWQALTMCLPALPGPWASTLDSDPGVRASICTPRDSGSWSCA